MKRIISILFLSLFVFLPLQANALSVNKNNLTIEKGSNQIIDLYAEVDTQITEVNFALVYTSYDVPAYFNIESGLRDEVSGIKHKIVFSVPVTGKIKLGTVRVNVVNNPQGTTGLVNIHTATATTSTGETINLDTQIINVTVSQTQVNNTQNEQPVVNTSEPEEKNTNLLEKIESKLVKIELKKDVYEYTVNIKEDIEELDLKPIAKDENYKVKITTQKISELTDNQIIITVEDEDNSEEYKIKVNVLEEIEKVEIDEEEFESTFKYKGKWVTLIIILSIVLVVGLFLNKKQ